MAEIKSVEKSPESRKGDFSSVIELLKKLTEAFFYSCELEKFINDLKSMFIVDKSNFPKVNDIQNGDRKLAKNIQILALLLRHICQSQKFSLMKEKATREDFSKHFLKFVRDATKRAEGIFCLVDFIEGIAKFLVAESESLDKSLEKSTRKISELTEATVKKRSNISGQIFLALNAVLSSNEIADFVENAKEKEDFQTGLMNLAKGFIVFSKFPQHKDFKDVCILDADSMPYFHENAFNCLRAINSVLEWLCKMIQSSQDSNMTKRFIKSFLKNCIDEIAFLMLQHIGKHNWTSTETMVEAQNLLNFLCKVTQSKGVESLLSGTENTQSSEKTVEDSKYMAIFPSGIAGLILENVCSKFVNDGWKRDVSLIHIITYVTTNIKFPNLKSHIKVIVPLLLEAIGDYRSENQVLGIECLRHLIENVTSSDLNLYNHGSLIYESLFKLMYGTKPPTLRVLLPCLHRVLYVLEPFPERVGLNRPSKWDQMLQKLVMNMEYENCGEAREILVANLSVFMNSMGVNCSRYLVPILKATSFCLEMYDNKYSRIRKQGLNVLKTLVTTCWPVMWRYIGSVVKIILKVIIDTSMKGAVVEESAKTAIKEKSKEILILLSDCCGPESVLDFMDSALNAEVGDHFQGTTEFLRSVKGDIELDGV